MKFKYSILSLSIFAILSTACSKDDDSEPTTSTTSYTLNYYSATADWPSQFYMGAKLSEVHTDIADLQLNCDSPEGYRLYMIDADQKDANGLKIYYIMADMDQVMQTTTTNEAVDMSVDCSLTGSKNTKNEAVKASSNMSVTWKRFYCPDPSSEALAKNWILSQEWITPYSSWVSFDSSGKAIFNYYSANSWTTENSPLTIKSSYDENSDRYDIQYFNTSTSLFGWLQTSDGHSLESKLDAGLWNTDANPEPAVFFIDDDQLKCMAIEYDEAGLMVGLHRYFFITED